MPIPLQKTAALAAEPSLFFCSTTGCPFHATVGDPNVQGFGDWATLADGTTVSHRWVNGSLLCDLCANLISCATRADQEAVTHLQRNAIG